MQIAITVYWPLCDQGYSSSYIAWFSQGHQGSNRRSTDHLTEVATELNSDTGTMPGGPKPLLKL
jgi:hypothetical protein